jgi:hypothetical protein
MGLLSTILTFPLSGPVAGIEWSLKQLQRVVDDELTNDTPIREALMELQLKLELGEVTDEEYVTRERELMDRLREVREWRERLGMETSGGPVRVTPADDTEP